ncbi:SpaA isopeptide-forming pilin-related protein [uncultured Corynebacterium sp.]|uniref:SpaA isopeptide-forming pilin-related protein n=1 Tax=uncultured Corynebacterium sp. TaxID=159447 RepID=UPI002618CC66|nr:SpaA isopeptide-forming pilin-related protein [uncultured Corynebacterium sp.]
MLNNTDRRPTQAAGAAQSGAVSPRAGFSYVAAVLLALCAAIALVAGLAFSAGTAPKAEAQACTIQNPQQFSGQVTYAYGSGTIPRHDIGLSFPSAAYVSEVSVTSKVKLGNESDGKWGITVGGQTFTNGSGVTVTYSAGSAGTVTFKFDQPVKVGANSDGVAHVTLFGQPGNKANYTMTYKGSVNDPCVSAPTTPNPTSKPTTTSTQPSTPASPTATTTGTQPTSGNSTPTTEPSTPSDPFAGTGEIPTNVRPAGPNEVGILVSAAAFRNDTTRYSSGIRFRLWTADESGTLFTASDKGPLQPVNQDWATCVTGPEGQCAIYVPNTFKGKYAFVVQENEYPGTFHIDQINWGKFGNYNKRTNAYLPGFVNLANARTGSTDPYWGKMFPLWSEQISTWKEIRSFGSSVQSLNNPPAEKARKCQPDGGPRIALVLDTTTSIDDAGGTKRYRDAVYGSGGLLDSLVGTGASVAFFPFAQHAKKNLTFANPVSVDTNLAQAKDNARRALSDIGATTNWQAGFENVINSGQQYDQIIFVTDGDANHWYNGGTTLDSVNIDGSVRGVEAGIYAANELKAKDMRIVSIGVASAENAAHWNGSGQLKAVSGPEYGVDYFGTDWDRLAATLRAAASEVTCQIEFEVNKVIVDGDGNKVGDQSDAADWKMNLEISDLINPQDDFAGGDTQKDTVEVAPFGYLSGDDNQIITSEKASTSGKTYGEPARLRWTLTQYADPSKINTSAVIREDVNSKSGFEFVAGQSTYEVQDSRSGAIKRRGTLQSAEQSFSNLKPGDKVVVTMVNRIIPEITLKKNLPEGRKNEGDQFRLEIAKVIGNQGSVYSEVPMGEAVTAGNQNGVQSQSAGPYKLEPNTRYLLRENAVSGGNLNDYETTLACTGVDAQPVPEGRHSGSGRVWEISTSGTVAKNIECMFTNKPELMSSISWEKHDNESNVLACSQWKLTRTKNAQGAIVEAEEWAVIDSAEQNCGENNTGLQEKTDSDSRGGYFTVDNLPLGTYELEEVQAPEGYGINQERYKATLELTAANAAVGVKPLAPFVNYPDITTPGTLPRTGGYGLGLPAGFAGLLLLIGVGMLYRRSVN